MALILRQTACAFVQSTFGAASNPVQHATDQVQPRCLLCRECCFRKNGKQRSDYEKALPDLLKFYQSIRKMSDLPFDVNRAARLELEWWISFYSKSFSIRKAGNDSPSGVRISVGSIILYPIAEYRGSPGNVATSSIFKKPACRAASSQHLMIRVPMPRRDHLGCT